MTDAGGSLKNRASPATGPPERFMYVLGLASTTRWPASLPSTTSALVLCALNLPPTRLGQFLDDAEADVVPVVRVARAGVAQTDHQEQLTHRPLLGTHSAKVGAHGETRRHGRMPAGFAENLRPGSGSAFVAGLGFAFGSGFALARVELGGGRRGDDVDDQGLRVDGQVDALRQGELARR